MENRRWTRMEEGLDRSADFSRPRGVKEGSKGGPGRLKPAIRHIVSLLDPRSSAGLNNFNPRGGLATTAQAPGALSGWPLCSGPSDSRKGTAVRAQDSASG